MTLNRVMAIIFQCLHILTVIITIIKTTRLSVTVSVTVTVGLVELGVVDTRYGVSQSVDAAR